MRCVKGAPAACVLVLTVFAATIKSFAFVVASEPLLLSPLSPWAEAVPSSGALGLTPLYSRIRTSGYTTAAENVTVTTFAPAAAAAIFGAYAIT
jgi:hypothetical protein